ncbi:PilN domain-containing protein [Candidatus Albibeggiatoa sp. nov. NOAA]|uniref:PilN domain-containing protein n=1 Tax=Candidatus Albibeggiatoa sp. nov. NOAA TaxID=3162724 RepID=UPI0032F80AB2|nr:PilN domain-containing protein [Thiotrichaceae bacterium]
MKNIDIKLPKLKLSKKRKQKLPKVDACLVLHGSSLLYTGDMDLVAQHDIELTTKGIAEAAKRLLINNKKLRHIALALSPEEFIATSLKLPAIDDDKLKGAVNLQLSTLLPGNTEPLLLAVQAQKQGQQTVALWLPSKRAESLFIAFEQAGLFLSCIVPRTLLTLPEKDLQVQVYDEDEQSVTFCEWSGTAVQRWLHFPKDDCDTPEFKKQIEQEIHLDHNQPHTKQHQALSDWEGLPAPSKRIYDYAFVPTTSILRQKQSKTQWNRIYMAAAAVVLVAIGILGFMANLYYKQNLQDHLDELRSQTLDVSQLKREVLIIEDEIKPIQGFPKQKVPEVLGHLNGVIPKKSYLSRLTLEGGTIQIEGFSPDAAQLVKILTEEPAYKEVRFSRGIGGEKDAFGIDFKLADVDVQAYWEEHFLVQERPRNRRK